MRYSVLVVLVALLQQACIAHGLAGIGRDQPGTDQFSVAPAEGDAKLVCGESACTSVQVEQPYTRGRNNSIYWPVFLAETVAGIAGTVFFVNYGTQTEHWHGVDVNLTARYIKGLLVQGGTSTGRTVTDNCDVLAKVPEPLESRSANSGLVTVANVVPLEYCHVATNWLTQVKFLGSYTVPRVDVLVSGTVQSLPGPEIQANYALPTAVAAKTLGRPLSGGAANVTVGLIKPGTQFGDRVNQVDLRIGKLLHLARMRESISIDLYNALNVSSILAQNNTFGASWLAPTQIMPPRFAKVSLQLDF